MGWLIGSARASPPLSSHRWNAAPALISTPPTPMMRMKKRPKIALSCSLISSAPVSPLPPPIPPIISLSEIHPSTAIRKEWTVGESIGNSLIPPALSATGSTALRYAREVEGLVKLLHWTMIKNFKVDAMEKFIKENSVPTVTIFNQDESNHPFLVKFFDSPNAKAMLFLNFSSELIDAFKSKYNDVAMLYKGKGLGFLLGDLEPSQAAFQVRDFVSLLE